MGAGSAAGGAEQPHYGAPQAAAPSTSIASVWNAATSIATRVPSGLVTGRRRYTASLVHSVRGGSVGESRAST